MHFNFEKIITIVFIIHVENKFLGRSLWSIIAIVSSIWGSNIAIVSLKAPRSPSFHETLGAPRSLSLEQKSFEAQLSSPTQEAFKPSTSHALPNHSERRVSYLPSQDYECQEKESVKKQKSSRRVSYLPDPKKLDSTINLSSDDDAGSFMVVNLS